MGAFPAARHANVLWAGADDVDRGLAAVAEVVEGVCERLGFAREQRPFTGHVTVGRAKGRGVDARAALDAFAARNVRPLGGTTVEEVHVYESRLGGEGSTYVLRSRAALEFQLTRRHDMATTTTEKSEKSRDQGGERGQEPEPDPRSRAREGDRRRRLDDREAVRQGQHHAPRRGDGPARGEGRFRPGRSASTSRSASAGCRAAGSSRFTGPSLRARRRWRCTSWARPSGWAASARSSTRSTRWTSATRASWACAPTICWCRSRTAASRRSRSRRCWSARAPSTSSSSTRSRR